MAMASVGVTEVAGVLRKSRTPKKASEIAKELAVPQRKVNRILHEGLEEGLFLQRASDFSWTLGKTALAQPLEIQRRAKKTSPPATTSLESSPARGRPDTTTLPTSARQIGPPVEWERKAERIAKGIESPPRDGDRCVYVILLEKDDKGHYGLYVGETSRTPKERFEQHKVGHKHSRVARKRGLRVLERVAAHLVGLSHASSKRIEAELADRLRKGGFKVEGGH
jgi:hypothetical protein